MGLATSTAKHKVQTDLTGFNKMTTFRKASVIYVSTSPRTHPAHGLFLTASKEGKDLPSLTTHAAARSQDSR